MFDEAFSAPEAATGLFCEFEAAAAACPAIDY
jgi:hypothetical protein